MTNDRASPGRLLAILLGHRTRARAIPTSVLDLEKQAQARAFGRLDMGAGGALRGVGIPVPDAGQDGGVLLLGRLGAACEGIGRPLQQAERISIAFDVLRQE